MGDKDVPVVAGGESPLHLFRQIASCRYFGSAGEGVNLRVGPGVGQGVGQGPGLEQER